MKILLVLITGLALFTFTSRAQSVSDYDGNLYDTILIGNQIWLKQNLKVTHFNNGDEIPIVTNNATWLGLTTGAYCNYNNSAGFAPTYGRLYNWFAVKDSRGICPTGWHVATDAEWTALTDLLGGEAVAGGKLKEEGTSHWTSPNTGATNEVDFTALGGGYRSNTATYIGFGWIGSWWCSTESSSTEAWARGIFNDAITVDRGGYYEKMIGFSVRCLKDETTDIIDFEAKEGIQIYPNPAVDKIYVNCYQINATDVKIYNLTGECIQHKSINQGNCEISINSLSRGIYIIEFRTNDKTVQRKFIKE